MAVSNLCGDISVDLSDTRTGTSGSRSIPTATVVPSTTGLVSWAENSRKQGSTMVDVPASAFTDETARSRSGIFCATDDFDVYRASINDAYYPARLEILGGTQQLSDARMLAVRLTHMTVGIVRFGADVLIDPGDVCGYHIDLPLSGSLDTSCGPQKVIATPQRAAVYTPGEHTFLSRWAADNTQVSIKIDRAALEQELGRILGRPVNGRVRFDIGFDLTTPAGRRWASTLQILLDTIADPGPV